jgi:hypothetical protein
MAAQRQTRAWVGWRTAGVWAPARHLPQVHREGEGEAVTNLLDVGDDDEVKP